MKQSTCKRCGAVIFLAKAGNTEQSYKWATNPEKPRDTWKCDPTPEAPVRSHQPGEVA